MSRHDVHECFLEVGPHDLHLLKAYPAPAQRGKHGLEITPTVRIDSLKSADLFALVIPGGWAPDKLRRHAVVTNLVREMNAAHKIIGIICHGGLVAISAGIVKDRPATGSLGIKDDLVNAGATWMDAPAFKDGNQVWGRVVEDIPDFCRELIAALDEAAAQTHAPELHVL